MVMAARMHMNTGRPPMRIDAKLITLTQWLSPNFPIGAFAFSHGLEAAVAEDWVHDGESLKAWLSMLLTQGSGRSDAIWVRLAYAAEDGAALEALNVEACAFAPSRSRLVEAERQGLAFVKTVRAVWAFELPDLLLPLAVGAASARQDLDVEMVVPLYLHAFASNLIAAAQRLMPLGQTDAQAVLASLHQEVQAVTEDTRGAGLTDIHSNAFLSDIASMRHETLEPRMFQS